MSLIRTAVRLADAELQYDALATAPSRHQREVFIPLTPNGDAVRVSTSGAAPGAATVIRASAVLTASYVGSTAVDLAGASAVVVRALVTVTNAAEVFSLKPQWSIDNSAWSDEYVLGNSTISSTENQFTPYSRVIQIDASAANDYIEKYNRVARYFRIAVKSTATTAKLSLTAQVLS